MCLFLTILAQDPLQSPVENAILSLFHKSESLAVHIMFEGYTKLPSIQRSVDLDKLVPHYIQAMLSYLHS